MPRANFVCQYYKINRSSSFPTPKRITELRYWLKAVQNVIKEIPRQIAESEASAERAIGNDGWFVAHTDVDQKWIRFDLEDRVGIKAQIVIDRSTGII